ncbi:hypothetical protein [Mycobacterium sp. SMC-4]|uniref:hypothetical protein n=1 Tax=Mycobacterium sp. SMC-4 TaxID=2857059 RepID=UPI0021B1FD84|nr:hypothetical protein [Mycobacterium sp. SMC-4]UXA17654.1 hypothetical protein KXD98_23595 [Mycobacterium sp. SMC-4]
MSITIVQLATPGARAIANADVGQLLRTPDVPEDHGFARVARLFFKLAGLHLCRYNRAGMKRAWPSDWDDSTVRLLDSGRELMAENEFEVFAPLGVSVGEMGETPSWDDELGDLYVEIPGVCSIRDDDQLTEFLLRWKDGGVG